MAYKGSPFQTSVSKLSGLSPMKQNGEEFNSERVEQGRVEAIKYISEDIYKSKLSKNNPDLSEEQIDTIINNRIERVRNAKIYLSEGGTAYAKDGNLYLNEGTTASTIGHEFGHLAGGSFLGESKPGDEFTLSVNDIKTISEGNIRSKQFHETGEMSVQLGGGLTGLEKEEVGSAKTKYITGNIDPETGLINTEPWGPLTPMEVSEDGKTGKAINPSHTFARHATYVPEKYANLFDLQLSLRRAGILGENEEVTIDHLKQLRDKSRSDTEIGAIDSVIKTYGEEEAINKLNTIASVTGDKLDETSALTMRVSRRSGL